MLCLFKDKVVCCDIMEYITNYKVFVLKLLMVLLLDMK